MTRHVYEDGKDRVVVQAQGGKPEDWGDIPGGKDVGLVTITREVRLTTRPGSRPTWYLEEEVCMLLSTWRKVVAHWAEGTETLARKPKPLREVPVPTCLSQKPGTAIRCNRKHAHAGNHKKFGSRGALLHIWVNNDA